jgi:shikimate kinase
VIIWLNGTFGAGKTTTGRRLAERLANARHFDPEEVGYLLRETLGDHEFRDFQDLAPWRELVPVVTESVARFTGQHLIAVQTVLREDYWRELTEGFERTRLDIFHVLLHVDSDVLVQRIKADTVEARACQWRLDHVSDYEKARPWMEAAADLILDTTDVPAAEVAELIAVEAEQRMAQSVALRGGIWLQAVAERARDQEPVAGQRGVEGALAPRPVFQRAGRRVHALMGRVNGFDLAPRDIQVELDAGAAEWPGLVGQELRLRRAEEDLRARQGHAGQRIAAVGRGLELELPAGPGKDGGRPVRVLGRQDRCEHDRRLRPTYCRRQEVCPIAGCLPVSVVIREVFIKNQPQVFADGAGGGSCDEFLSGSAGHRVGLVRRGRQRGRPGAGGAARRALPAAGDH